MCNVQYITFLSDEPPTLVVIVDFTQSQKKQKNLSNHKQLQQ